MIQPSYIVSVKLKNFSTVLEKGGWEIDPPLSNSNDLEITFRSDEREAKCVSVFMPIILLELLKWTWCPTLRKGKCCLTRGEKEACSVEFG